MSVLSAKSLLVIVTGGIAAYKTPDIVRRLKDTGADVRVVMTAAATEFVTPLTLQAVSGNDVRTGLFDSKAELAMGHIELARWCDAIVVAPASADFISKLSHGRADDLAGAVCLAARVPILVTPAMNQQMWQHSATQANLRALEERGVSICGPGIGSQACGEFGPGRMEASEVVVTQVEELFETDSLSGLKVLMTVGPTIEPIDPVRFITNHSSGKMGLALGAACAEAGAKVFIVLGPTREEIPPKVQVERVETARSMLQSVDRQVEGTDIFIATAAVADYRPTNAEDEKIKRSTGPKTLELIPNPDILRSVTSRSKPPFTVGFAAETENLALNAKNKLEAKKVDMIVGNLVGQKGTGFNADENELEVYWHEGLRKLLRKSKTHLARELVELISERYKKNKGKR
jgi:phosphopantothenoylcysteine decarboxylase/phosphopantothenate--cysteine ligase